MGTCEDSSHGGQHEVFEEPSAHSPSLLPTHQLLVPSIQGQSGNWNFVFSWRECANDSFGCQGAYYLSEELTYLWAAISDLWLCTLPQFSFRAANRHRTALQAHSLTPHLLPDTTRQHVAHLCRYPRVKGKWKMNPHNSWAGPEEVNNRPTEYSLERQRQLQRGVSTYMCSIDTHPFRVVC